MTVHVNIYRFNRNNRFGFDSITKTLSSFINIVIINNIYMSGFVYKVNLTHDTANCQYIVEVMIINT
jgi:hypothetical protein